jgi:hypothetical protein
MSRTAAKLAATTTLVFALLALPACVSPTERYRPRENVSATSPQGDPAAAYDLSIRGLRAASVRVWSTGTHVEKDGEVQRAVLGVSLELENNGEDTLELTVDRLRLDEVAGSARELSGVTIEEMQRAFVAPREARTLEVEYVLPSVVDGDDVRAFRIDWTVRGLDGSVHESTPFRADQTFRTASGYGYSGPYYGYWGPWGPGYGYGWYGTYGWYGGFGSRCW